MLKPEEKLRLLSMVDILEPLSKEEIKELSYRIPDTHLKRGQIFYTPKERAEKLFMLKQDGCASTGWARTAGSSP